jgi:uncharacterized protein YecA (UPF0149 family)
MLVLKEIIELTRQKREMEDRLSAAQPTTADGQRRPRRNDPCPCGSGKKYKHCCQRNDLNAENVK